MNAPPLAGEPLLVITGPTASGKEALSLALARRLGGEIISMDSMKIYRDLDILTAKPTAEDLERVPHHLIDSVDPAEDFSVGVYLGRLERAISDVRARGRQAIVSGGTALYLKAFLYGLVETPSPDWELRRQLAERAEREGLAVLHAELERLDPRAAEKISAGDERRIVRALEVCRKTGRAASDDWTWPGADPIARPYPVLVFAVEWCRKDLYSRIDARVERMVERGLFNELSRLAERDPPPGRTASQSIGYKEFVLGRSEAWSEDEITARIQQQSRRLAKHQLTWFRKFAIDWIPSDDANPEAWADEVLRRARERTASESGRPETR